MTKTRENRAQTNGAGRDPGMLCMLSESVIVGALSGTIAGLLEIALIVPTHLAFHSKSLAGTVLLPPLANAPFFIAANVAVALGIALIILAGRRLDRDAVCRILAGANGVFVTLFLLVVYRTGIRDASASLIDQIGLAGFLLLLSLSLLVLPWIYGRVLLPALDRSRVIRHAGAALIVSISVMLGLVLGSGGGKAGAHSGVSGPRRVGDPDADNVLLITIDTQRADYLGCYRGDSVETPNIDRLAGEGVRFASCVAQAPTTLPSHTTIMTGTYPTFHRVRSNHGYKVPDSVDTLAEVLRANGYRTGGFVSAFVLDSRFGIQQGFDTYDCELSRLSLLSTGPIRRTLSSTAWRALLSSDTVHTDRNAGDTTERAVRWLESAHPGPFFLWIHYFDPHSPYDPPQPYRARYLDEVAPDLEGTVTVVTLAGRSTWTRAELEREKALYRGEIGYMDENVGTLLDALRRRGLLERTLVVLTADHGESFAENDYYGHGKMLNPPSIQVPLIFRRPGTLPGGVTVGGVARSVDIMPTILDALGIDGPDAIQGETLLPYMKEEAVLPDRPIYSEAMSPPIDDVKRIGLIRGGWKFVMAPQGPYEALYRLSTDPAETENLVEAEPEKAREMKARLIGMVRETSSSEEAERIELDEDAVSALRALGYVQ